MNLNFYFKLNFLKFIKEYRASESKTVAIMNKFEIHITPLLNPDGYEYSHTTVVMINLIKVYLKLSFFKVKTVEKKSISKSNLYLCRQCLQLY